MTAKFEGTRKELVKAIEEITGQKSKYLGVPTMAYQIGDITVTRTGEIESENTEALQEIARSLNGEEPTDTISIEMPRANFTDEAIENIKRIAESKAGLLKKAFGTNDLRIEVTENRIIFPWFTDTDAEAVKAYMHFVSAICKMAMEQKRISAKERTIDNEKYAFRCFLLRLGFIGDEYKTERKILLKNLTGSAAFKSGQKKGATDEH